MASWFKWLLGYDNKEQSMRDELAFYTSDYYVSQDYSKDPWDECQERIKKAQKRGYDTVECSPWVSDDELAKLRAAGHQWAWGGRLDENGKPDSPTESYVTVWVKK